MKLHQITRKQAESLVAFELTKDQMIFKGNRMHLPDELKEKIKHPNPDEHHDITGAVQNGCFFIFQITAHKILNQIYLTESEAEANELVKKIYLSAHEHAIRSSVEKGYYIEPRILNDYPSIKSLADKKRGTFREINEALLIIQNENKKYFNPAMIPSEIWTKAESINYNKTILDHYAKGLKIFKIKNWCGWALNKKNAERKAKKEQ
jgi:hypothetical protein